MGTVLQHKTEKDEDCKSQRQISKDKGILESDKPRRKPPTTLPCVLCVIWGNN